jgi:hypothetical protein
MKAYFADQETTHERKLGRCTQMLLLVQRQALLLWSFTTEYAIEESVGSIVQSNL